MSKKSTSEMSIKQFSIFYLIIFLLDALIIFLANYLFPTRVVLGTFFITPLWSIIHGAGTLVIFNALGVVLTQCECKKKKLIQLEKTRRCLLFLPINFLGIWLISRFSHQLGVGVSSWFITLVLALATTLAQKLTLKKLSA